jgi:hypothetical protein
MAKYPERLSIVRSIRAMRFPDPNIGYVFGYGSKITDDAVLVTFLGGAVKIPFRFGNIECIGKETYRGGRISWDVLRWGKCPAGTVALKIRLKSGPVKDHLIVFDNPDAAIRELACHGQPVG